MYVEIPVRRSFNGTVSGTGILDVVYSQSIDAAKLEAQEDLALAISSSTAAADWPSQRPRSGLPSLSET